MADTLMALLQTTAGWLGERGIANGRREAEWIFAHVLKLSRLELYTGFDMPLDGDQVDALRAAVRRRGRREPLAYILGTQPFAGLELQVDASVLVPRPETEELVEHVLAEIGDQASGRRVLDVGTGSGAIALAVVHARPQAEVHAVEISAAALATAQANGQRLGLEVVWHQGDLAADLPGDWHVVVANLPYIAESERQVCDPELAFEPAGALFAEDEGLALMDRLIADADRLLAPKGALWLEHGYAQADALAHLADRYGLTASHHQDGAGHTRCTRLVRAND